MNDRAIVSGVLWRAPAVKTSKSGKEYVVATIRSGSGENVRWWSCLVFSASAIEGIAELAEGEPIAVAGEFDVEIYAAAGGDSRLSWKIIADAVLTARRKPKAEPTARAKPPPKRPLADERGAIDDEIPF